MSWYLEYQTHTLSTQRSLMRTRTDHASMARIAVHGTRDLISRHPKTEVAFHKSVEYAEIDFFQDSVTYDDYLADFSGSFHDLREALEFKAALDPDSYIASQELGEELLEAGSLGVVYPSVRRTGGTCLACFRPALVGNVRKDKRYRFTWSGKTTPEITCESEF